MRIIVGMTGATGVIYGVRLLQRLREAGVETHLVISKWGARTLLHETPYSREQVEALATEVYAPGDMGAAIASGSFQTAGMIIALLAVACLMVVNQRFDPLFSERERDQLAADPLVDLARAGGLTPIETTLAAAAHRAAREQIQAKNIARRNESEALLHGRDGQIRARNTYGHDPRRTGN